MYLKATAALPDLHVQSDKGNARNCSDMMVVDLKCSKRSSSLLVCTIDQKTSGTAALAPHRHPCNGQCSFINFVQDNNTKKCQIYMLILSLVFELDGLSVSACRVVDSFGTICLQLHNTRPVIQVCTLICSVKLE